MDATALSKTISYALRHNPAEFGFTLDGEGWVALTELVRAIQQSSKQFEALQESDIRSMMAAAKKQRFEIADGRIRAIYGHSVNEQIEYAASVPPEILYHGTTPQASEAIRQTGLQKMSRQYVHLSADMDGARIVAVRRTGAPVILKVRALEAYRGGLRFYHANESVWLADDIPALYIDWE